MSGDIGSNLIDSIEGLSDRIDHIVTEIGFWDEFNNHIALLDSSERERLKDALRYNVEPDFETEHTEHNLIDSFAHQLVDMLPITEELHELVTKARVIRDWLYKKVYDLFFKDNDAPNLSMAS